MSTTDFEAIDPLGGILHPNWKNRQAEAAARARRFIVIRAALRIKDGVVDYVKAYDEPNMTTGDVRLDVDPWETEKLTPLSQRQDENFEQLTAALAGARPTKTKFYDTSFSPEANRRHTPPSNQQER